MLWSLSFFLFLAFVHSFTDLVPLSQSSQSRTIPFASISLTHSSSSTHDLRIRASSCSIRFRTHVAYILTSLVLAVRCYRHHTSLADHRELVYNYPSVPQLAQSRALAFVAPGQHSYSFCRHLPYHPIHFICSNFRPRLLSRVHRPVSFSLPLLLIYFQSSWRVPRFSPALSRSLLSSPIHHVK